MALIKDIEDRDNDRAAARLLRESRETRSQQDQVRLDIDTKKALIKNDIVNDRWILNDLKNLINLISMDQNLTTKKIANRAELLIFKNLLTNPTYKDELSFEVNLLDGN